MATIEIVAAGAGDEAELIRLARAFHAEHGYDLSQTSITGLSLAARGHDLARAWLARDHARSLGYAVLARGFAVDHGGPVAVLEDLYVVPAARGRGIGAALVARLSTRRASSASPPSWSSPTRAIRPRCASTAAMASPRSTA